MASTLGAMPVGSIVKLKENGTPADYIVVHQGRPGSRYDTSCNGTWLLRKDIAEKRSWHNTANNKYASSDIHAYLSSAFLARLESNIQRAILQVKIPYCSLLGTNVSSGAEGLSTKVFLLSGCELGFSSASHGGLYSDGEKLSFFLMHNDTDALNKRKAYYNGVETQWWTRTAVRNFDDLVWCSADSQICTHSYGLRPAMILQPDTKVLDDGTVTTNTAPSTPPSIHVPGNINGGSTITVSWGASGDAEGNLAGYRAERSVNGGGWTQFYQGAGVSCLDSITFGWNTVQYRVKAYDSEGFESGYATSAQVSVFNNTAPSMPGAVSVPNPIYGGNTITISWGASSDAQGNLAGYYAERSTNGGASWERIYQGAGTSATHFVAFGTGSVMYRVKAYDSGGLESGYRNSNQVTVINNVAPNAPAGIYAPLQVDGGKPLTITWSAASDNDGNLAGYALERSVNGGDYAEIFRGNALSHTDQITKGWDTVAYRVRAYDTYTAYSGYATSATRSVNNNTAPTITCSAAHGSELGTKSEGFHIEYTVNDVDGDAITVTETLDGVVKRTFSVAAGTTSRFDVTGEYFMRVLNGAHTLTVTASDGKASATHALSFTKRVTAAAVTLAEPMRADGAITLAVLSVTGFIPEDADFRVEMTNNANDQTPAWEDCTNAVRKGINHVFANQAAANGFAFNFRISLARGGTDVSGSLVSVQGGFQ